MPDESSARHLSLTESVVLALVREGPTHGFALARLVGPDQVIGRIFRIPRPVVYRALDRLLGDGLIRIDGVQPSNQGPQRTRYRATRTGLKVTDAWLNDPVTHIRDIRTELLVKLTLLERADRDTAPLAEAQRRIVVPIVTSLEQQASEGSDRIVSRWRYESARAALRFLDALVAE